MRQSSNSWRCRKRRNKTAYSQAEIISSESDEVPVDESLVWFCSVYQRNECDHKSSHTAALKGISKEERVDDAKIRSGAAASIRNITTENSKLYTSNAGLFYTVQSEWNARYSSIRAKSHLKHGLSKKNKIVKDFV
ncbi:uncharacterized protein LOC123537432 [Mercenaria mercenaria]|uniref:uncharacterized protein LOC123537432 n=1 Tax=Mercenaria mercenaria TaxID=6596 RepID=UPI00234EBB8F|nr:uncharacterized protein LOC123537432 [Mercenaria mercenaria]